MPTESETSVYSRPSYDLSYYYNDNNNFHENNNIQPTSSTYEDISPPSSPEPEHQPTGHPRRYRSMRDVSPVEENRRKMETSLRVSTDVPVLRRAPPAVQTGQESGPKQKFWEMKLAPNSKVRWDAYSGEPNIAGKAPSVTPGSYAKDVTQSDVQPMGYKVSVTGGEPQRKISLAERVGRFRARSPLNLSRKPLSPPVERTGRETPNKLEVPSYHDPSADDTSAIASETHSPDMHNDLIKPTVPLKVGKNSPPRSGLTSPTSPTNQGLGIHPFTYPSPTTPTNRQQVPTLDPNEEQGSSFAELYPTSRSETPPYNTSDTKKDKHAQTSHFSWTTYNSATTYQHSPPPSPPTLPGSITQGSKQSAGQEPMPAAASILNRRRPIKYEEPLPPRKPVPSFDMLSSSSRPHSPSAASTFSTSSKAGKALPVPPTSLSASDHVSFLESQVEDLRIRRNNVYRLLKDLNNAAPPNPLVTDFKKARLVEQRKKSFEDELSEIKREEHDIGLKLHRAWKKREREDPNAAGSALWVRRVTS